MNQKIIALDADGVLLDYNLAYARAWERAFGVYPKQKDPHAYWAIDRWDVPRLEGDQLEHFRVHFDQTFWESLPAMSGAIEACRDLHAAGYQLLCVSALPEHYAYARQRNLRQLGFPIHEVFATGKLADGKNPKADILNVLRPCAFVDDFLPYMSGVHPDIHLALILRNESGSPNTGEQLNKVTSTHRSLLDFARWWVGR